MEKFLFFSSNHKFLLNLFKNSPHLVVKNLFGPGLLWLSILKIKTCQERVLWSKALVVGMYVVRFPNPPYGQSGSQTSGDVSTNCQNPIQGTITTERLLRSCFLKTRVAWYVPQTNVTDLFRWVQYETNLNWEVLPLCSTCQILRMPWKTEPQKCSKGDAMRCITFNLCHFSLKILTRRHVRYVLPRQC